LSEIVSTRLPPELIRLMEKEAEAKGISLSTLLKEIVEEHYGVEQRKPEKPFIIQLQEIINTLGKAKMDECRDKENCPLKALGPSPLLCALCQVHSHMAGFIPTSPYNPYFGLSGEGR